VVASGRGSGRGETPSQSQSPSLRGSGRFVFRNRRYLFQSYVSIPFIAGQWSLLWNWTQGWCPSGKSQSPSLRGSGRFRRRASQGASHSGGLNPLHCGAVVASGSGPSQKAAWRPVLIPFIAGQWSLPRRMAGAGKEEPRS